ncbi:TerB N-terminal domain-containing protein [Methanospirillum lacunae]|uniref:Uncharacterized protein n=1 Tax=Methanospirillum lacunae TaxID=668570 RepID=A0A2V2MYM4_9EURY|nr:TerB N-terminal domain-containing protein [Methanospirillum lacunae]PWR72559.1 hypothetical protein DK846_06220 [Methanospirillum lacunae]
MNSELSSSSISDSHSHGYALIHSSNFQKAIEHFNHLIYNNSKDYLAYQGLSISLEKQGNIDDAILSISKAIEINPNLSTLYVFRSLFLLKANKNSEALINIKKGLDLDPNNEITQNIFRTIQEKTNREKPKFISVPINWGGRRKNGVYIQKFSFSNPLVYWSQGKSDSIEPSCIDVTLPIGSYSNTIKRLPSFPNYSNLDPDQRYLYLSWLHEGRKKKLEDDGYLFLYFFGLERRIFLDNEDYGPILNECYNLKKIVSSPSSNFSFISSFIAYLLGKRILNLSNKELSNFYPPNDEIGPDELKVILSWYIQHQKPISGLLSYLILYYFLNVPKNFDKKTIREKRDLFLKLFKHYYPSGFTLQVSRFPYRFKYYAANPTIRDQFQHNGSIDEIILQNPIGKKSQFNPLRELWIQSINLKSIDELNNSLEKNNEIILNKKDSSSNKKFQLVDVWESIILPFINNEDEDIIISISEFNKLKTPIEHITIDSEKISSIISFIKSQGYEVVPSNYGALESADYVGLVLSTPNSESHSIQYNTAVFFIELGMHIAHADKKITSEELNYLSDYVTNKFILNSHDLECIRLYQKILISHPPNINFILKRVKDKVPFHKREIIASYIVDIIIADNVIHDLEIASLSQVLESMDIPKSEVEILIQNRLIKLNIQDESSSLISIKTSVSLDKGELIQSNYSVPIINSEENNVIIDKDDEIVVILDGVFNNNQDKKPVERKLNLINKTDLMKYELLQHYIDYSVICSLEKQYYPVLEALLNNLKWSNKSFHAFVKENNLFGINHVIDALNMWSITHYDDYVVIEDDNGIFANPELLSKIIVDKV